MASLATDKPKDYSTFLNNVKKALQLGAEVTELPGRETEAETLYNFFKTHIENRTVGSIYISGSPGTGKTAVVTKTVEKIKTWVSKENCKKKNTVPMPHIVFLNGVTVAGQGHSAIFDEVYRQFTGDYENTIQDAVGLLEKKFLPKRRNKNTRPVVVIIDEIDALFSKSSSSYGSRPTSHNASGSNYHVSAQSPLYRLFEWPARANSICTIVGIANSVDLIQRLLPMLRRKKLEPTSIVFEPYDKNQITEILLSRLNAALQSDDNGEPLTEESKTKKRKRGTDAKTEESGNKMNIPFDRNGLELVARSVAANSGDARKALDVLRQAIVRAVQQKERQDQKARMNGTTTGATRDFGNQSVRLSHVSKSIKNSFGSKHINSIRSLPREAAIVLIAGVLRAKKANNIMSVLEFYSCYSKLKRSVRMEPVSMPVCIQLISRLEQMGLVSKAKGGGSGRNKKMRLNVLFDDVQFALENEEAFYKKLLEASTAK